MAQVDGAQSATVFVEDPGRRSRRLSRDSYVCIALVGAIALMLAVFGLESHGREFISTNLINILDTSAILGVVTIGEAIVMINGGIDISVGAMTGLVTAALGETLGATHGNIVIGVLAALGTGAVAGAVNGVAIAYGRVSAIIATLATFSAYAGFALLLTNGVEVNIPGQFLATIGTGSIVRGVPYLVVILIGATALAILAMRYWLGGHYVYAVGGNPKAARLTGIRVQRIKLGVFIVSGMCAGLGGIMLAGQTGAAQPTESQAGLELTAITAVLLGGTGLTGGTGTVLGAVLGVVVLSTLDNGLLLTGVPDFWQQVATGVLLVVAVLLQDLQGHRQRLHTLRAARARAREQRTRSAGRG